MNNLKEEKLATLTDDNLDQLMDFLKDEVTEDTQNVRNLLSNQGVEDTVVKGELKKMDVAMQIDPNTGAMMPLNLNDEAPNADISITDIDTDNNNMSDLNITEDMVAKRSEFGDLSDEDSKELLKVIMRYKKGEKFSVYNAFPQSIKNMAGKIAYQTNGNKNSIAKLMLDQFINDIELDQAFIEFNDSILKELNLFNVTDIYSEHRLNIMENKMLETAKNIESEFPEKAELLRGVSAAFTETYKMDVLKNALNNRKIRQALKDVSNYNKVCRDFNIKYEKSKFKINNVLMLAPVLNRKLSNEYTTEDIIKFVMLFCKECNLRDTNDILDHTFMYYTIQNILMLDYLNDNENANEFTKQLLNNICEVIDKIREI